MGKGETVQYHELPFRETFVEAAQLPAPKRATSRCSREGDRLIGLRNCRLGGQAFSETCRDLLRDPGVYFNLKIATPCSTARERFEQGLGHLSGLIDGVSIAVNPRNDEAALHDSYEHQRKLVGIEAFRDFSVGLSFTKSCRKELLQFAEIAFDRFPQRNLGDGRLASKSTHPATLKPVASNVEKAEDAVQPRTICSDGLAREFTHFIGNLTQSHRREVHFSLEVVIETALPCTTFFQQVAGTYAFVAALPHQLLGRLNKLALRLHDILMIASNQLNVIVFCNY